MRYTLQFICLICLFVALLSAANGLPSGFQFGPASNRGPIGGPASNGGNDQSTDNIIIHSNGQWRYR